jgi:8-oxo-dGTP pyrophosphatase MutT (NUDIX family)
MDLTNMITRSCETGCCIAEIYPYVNKYKYRYRKTRKSGVFFYDPEKQKILIVQSNGKLWGVPKGTLEEGETIEQGAIREVKEETGLDIDLKNPTKITKIDKAYYYYVEKDECQVHVQKYAGNDANGIAWIKLECLESLIRNSKLKINRHFRILVDRFLDVNLPRNP